MGKHYRVVFFGIMVDTETFKQNMARLRVSGSTLDKYIKKAPIVLKRDLGLSDARQYADAIMSAGGIVTIQETGEFQEPQPSPENRTISSIQDFVLCPNCGFKQRKEDVCVRCSFDLRSPP